MDGPVNLGPKPQKGCLVHAVGRAGIVVDIAIAGVCGGGGSDASVTVTVPYDFMVLDAIAPSLGTSIPLEGSSVMRNEG